MKKEMIKANEKVDPEQWKCNSPGLSLGQKFRKVFTLQASYLQDAFLLDYIRILKIKNEKNSVGKPSSFLSYVFNPDQNGWDKL